MNSLYIVMHRGKKEDREVLLFATEALQKAACRYGLEDWVLEKYPEFRREGLLQPSECDAVLSIGGDGTFLKAAAIALEAHRPILGVNIGRLGFLAEMDLKAFPQCLPAFLQDRFVPEEQMVLEATIGSKTGLALNDVVVRRFDSAKTVDLDVQAGREKLGHFIADGYIVATPAGSTGYAVSAGGPIVSPRLDCMVLVPICSHSLSGRAVLIPPSEEVTIYAHEDRRYRMAVYCDGRDPMVLSEGEKLKITVSSQKLCVMRFHDYDFFHLVHEKLNLH